MINHAMCAIDEEAFSSHQLQNTVVLCNKLLTYDKNRLIHLH